MSEWSVWPEVCIKPATASVRTVAVAAFSLTYIAPRNSCVLFGMRICNATVGSLRHGAHVRFG
jgi:hypothetical protein